MYPRVKQVLDLVLGLVILILIAPLMIAGLIGSAIAHRSNPLFVQERTGKGGKPFKVFKIKSMSDVDPNGDNSDAARLTWFGTLIRKTSVDELPQIFNILRGEMSFIGPRPQIHSYYELMLPHERKRYDVTPGISGWSQVNGRNGVTWRQRFEQDVWYVENMSLKLDLLIGWRTIMIVLTGSGVSSGGHVTMLPLHEELTQARAETARREAMPAILAEVVRNSPRALVSFSLHDREKLHPVSVNPSDLFLFYKSTETEPLHYENVYLDVWRCPEDSSSAFPIGTAGPFNVEIADDVKIMQHPSTKIHQDRQPKPALKQVIA